MTGEVTEYTVTDDVTIGGTKYSYNKTVGDSADGQSGTTYTIKEKATVVLDQYGYIIYVDDALTSNSYVFIKEADQAVGVGNRVAADAYFTDGTNETIILKKVNGSTTLGGKMSAQGSWWIFTKDSNGEYTLNPMKSTLTAAVGTAKVAGGTAIAVIKNDKINFMPNVSGTYTVSGTSKNVNAVKGNSSTMFIVVEADGTVTATTGIKNAPDVTTGTTAPSSGGNNATVTAAVKANGYAEYVFVDMSKDANAKVDGSENAADYMLLLKYTGNKTTDINNDTYYKYKVLFDGQETEKYVESNLLPGGTPDHAGLLFRNVKQNSKGFVTGATKFDDNVTGVTAPAVPGKRVEITLNTGKVSIEKDVLTLASKSFYTADAKVNLLIGKGANDDLIDQGKDYQLYQTSAKAAASILKDYKLEAKDGVDSKAYVLLDDNGSEIATNVYIYVAKATYDGTSGGDGSSHQVPKGIVVDYSTPADIKVYAVGDDTKVPTVDKAVEHIKAQLAKDGHTKIEVSKDTVTLNKFLFKSLDKDGYVFNGAFTAVAGSNPAKGAKITVKANATAPTVEKVVPATDVVSTLIPSGKGMVVSKDGGKTWLAGTEKVENGADYVIGSSVKSTVDGSKKATGIVGSTVLAGILAGNYSKISGVGTLNTEVKFPAAASETTIDDGYYKVVVDENTADYKKNSQTVTATGEAAIINGVLTEVTSNTVTVADKDLTIISGYYKVTAPDTVANLGTDATIAYDPAVKFINTQAYAQYGKVTATITIGADFKANTGSNKLEITCGDAKLVENAVTNATVGTNVPTVDTSTSGTVKFTFTDTQKYTGTIKVEWTVASGATTFTATLS